MMALTSSSASIFLPDNYLDTSPSLSMALSLMCHHLWHPPWCGHNFMCGSLIFCNPNSYIDHDYSTYDNLNRGY